MITIETLKDLAKHDPDIASWAAFLQSPSGSPNTGDNQDDKLMDVIGGNVMFPETREEAEEIFQRWDMDGHELLPNNKRIMYAITNNSGGPTFVFLPHVWDSKFQRYVDELETIPEEDRVEEVDEMNYFSSLNACIMENDYYD